MCLVLYSYSVITVHSLDFVWKTFSAVGKKYMEIVFHFPDFFCTPDVVCKTYVTISPKGNLSVYIFYMTNLYLADPLRTLAYDQSGFYQNFFLAYTGFFHFRML